ncbi:MAG: CobW family GTP-binding protein [Neptuniibacter sp.]
MSSDADLISSVPTNIITGFLGAGKTSAILNLLKNKPSNERWAVLVNEFGEIGIDGSIIQGTHAEEEGVYIREVPGGCMCCTAGVPMQTALNQLLKKSRPDRLLIEPTGLGHPIEVLQTLTGKHFRNALSLQKIITMIDARNLSDARYTGHSTFNQQISIADVIIGNKQDLYQPADEQALHDYIQQNCDDGVEITLTQQGQIPVNLLTGPTKTITLKEAHQHHHDDEDNKKEPEVFPECGYIKAINSGEGYQSIGWRFPKETEFNQDELMHFFNSLNSERMKAVFNTNTGCFSYNVSNGTVTETRLRQADQSRIEIISTKIDESWEQKLLDCRSL